MNKVKKIIKFSASWCAPCRAFAPIFDKVSHMEEFNDIEFKAIDVDDETAETNELCSKYEIKNIPTVILLDEKNNVMKKYMGAYPEQAFIKLIQEVK